MTAGTTLTDAQRTDLLESLRSLSTVFWGPDLEQCRAIRSQDYFRPLERLAPVLGNAARDALDKLKDLVQGFQGAPVLLDRLEEEYIVLFVNARGGIAAPLYQSCYPDADAPRAAATLMGAPAVRMQQRFASRGIDLDTGLNEPPDHLAVEVEYLYFLIEKGWAEKDPGLLGEAVDFTNTELLVWIPGFEKRLQTAPTGPFYPLLTAILVAVLRLTEKI